MSKEQTDLLPFEELPSELVGAWAQGIGFAADHPTVQRMARELDWYRAGADEQVASPSPAGGVQGVTEALDRARKTLDQAKATGENPTSQRALEYRLGELIDLVRALSSQAQTTGGVE